MAKEKQDGGEVEFYTPKELRAMLDTANSKAEFAGLLPVIARVGRDTPTRSRAADMGGRVPRQGPRRDFHRQEQDPLAPVGDSMPGTRPLAQSLPRPLRSCVAARPGPVVRRVQRLARLPEHSGQEERTSPRLLHIPLRLSTPMKD